MRRILNEIEKMFKVDLNMYLKVGQSYYQFVLRVSQS